MMTPFNSLSLYVYSFAILCVIGYKTYRNEDRETLQSRLFLALIGLNGALLIVDGLSSGFDGFGGLNARKLLQVVSIANLSLQTSITYVWLRFVREVSTSQNRHGRLSELLRALPLATAIALLVTTPLTGIGFRYTATNHYARTLWTYGVIAVDFAYILMAYLTVIGARRRNGWKKTAALLSFALPPAISGVLQLFVPMLGLVWPSLTVSLLINYLAIQSEQLFFDHLTGVHNRRGLDVALKRKIGGNQRSGIFGLLLIDLDEFKSINDEYGHIEGDHALEATAQLLRRCFHNNDFIARYGGDEFLIIVDLLDGGDLVRIESRLQEQVARWNEASESGWKLAFSVGSLSYPPDAVLSPESCLRQIDALLYERKRENRKVEVPNA